MNARFARLLTSLYPRRWRARYAEEFQTLLQSNPGSQSLLSTTANILFAAFKERIRPTPLPKGAQAMPPASSPVNQWTNRAPWAIFTLTPVALLAAAYFVACLILWSGWKIFLPQISTPFVPVDGAAILYFSAGRALYYSAPLLIGWTVALVAARRHINALWPAMGLALVALISTSAQVYANQPIPGHGGHVGMRLALIQSASITRALMLFAISALPWLIWQIKARAAAPPPAV